MVHVKEVCPHDNLESLLQCSQGLCNKGANLIELPYCSLLMENSRRNLVREPGPILHFVQEDEFSSYPHDRACILQGTTCPTPR